MLRFSVINSLVCEKNHAFFPERSPKNLDLGTQKTPMVMVWASITSDNGSTLVFIDRGVKIDPKYYQENILEDVLKA